MIRCWRTLKGLDGDNEQFLMTHRLIYLKALFTAHDSSYIEHPFPSRTENRSPRKEKRIISQSTHPQGTLPGSFST